MSSSTPTHPLPLHSSVLEQMEAVKQALHDVAPSAIHSESLINQRKFEAISIRSFVTSCVRNKVGGFLYVCGLVGTGKSSLVRTFLKQEWISSKCFFQILDLDCTHFTNAPSHIFNQLRQLSSLTSSSIPNQPSSSSSSTSSSFGTTTPLSLLIIDEFDELYSSPKGTHSLREIVKLATSEYSNVIVIGIGNDVNLIEKMCTKTEHFVLSPIVSQEESESDQISEPASSAIVTKAPLSIVRFGNYSEDVVAQILQHILGKYHVYSPSVLAYIGKMSQKTNGDIRTVLLMAREPLMRTYVAMKEYLESTNTTPESSSSSPPSSPPLASSSTSSISVPHHASNSLSFPNLPISLHEISLIIGEMFDEIVPTIAGLPSQVQLFLAALHLVTLSLEKKAASEEDIYANYEKICKFLCICPLSHFVLFQECVNQLVDLHFIEDQHSTGRKGMQSGTCICLLIDGEDVQKGVCSRALIQQYYEQRDIKK